jgi:hypothetical protein
MKRFILLLLIVVSISHTKAQELVFSDSVKVSLLTCSPGQEVYEKFGHTAIRIYDPKSSIDVVFNYGIFDFETSYFYYKFLNGETDYQLGVYYTGNFLASYSARNSSVSEQLMNLTIQERKKLIQMLLLNYEPQNRIYRYNFVFDNCATRPRDKIQESLNGYLKYENGPESKTFRQWIDFYVGNDTWAGFGINLALGMDADKQANLNESMFLPEVLMYEFQHAQIIDHHGNARKFISDKKDIVAKNNLSEIKSNAIKPIALSIVLLIIGSLLTTIDLYRNHHTKIFDSSLNIITGFAGIILAYLSIFSVHPLVKFNLNLLWLNPINIVLGIAMWFPKLRTQVFFYEIFNVFLLVCALIVFALSVQTFNQASFPLIVLLLLRSSTWLMYLKKRMYKRRSVI